VRGSRRLRRWHDRLPILCFRFLASPLPHKPDKSGYPRRYDQGIVGVEAACLPQDRHRNKNDPQQCIKIFFEEAFGLRWPDFRKFQSSDGLARIASSWTLWQHGSHGRASRSSSSGSLQNNKEFRGSRPPRIRRCPLVCQLPANRLAFRAAARRPR